MNRRGNRPSLGWLLTICAVLIPGEGVAAEWLPLTLSGGLGYNFRWFSGADDQRTISREGLASINASSYIWRPWLATTDLSLTAALDKSSGNNNGDDKSYIKTDSSIVTGVWNVNALSQGRTPFAMRYAASDTRVDNSAIDTDAFVLLAGNDAKARNLSLQQSFLAESGHRLSASYDNSRWYTETNGFYKDSSASLQGELLLPRQRLGLNGRHQQAIRSITDEQNTNTLFDLSHYYYPSQALRVDTRMSTSNIERMFEIPSSNNQSGTATSDINQLSSYLFWRPEGSRFTASGGVRAFKYQGENSSDSALANESKNVTANAGAYYQYSKSLRFDGSALRSTTDSSDISRELTRGHLGTLFQSDLRQLQWLQSMNYQWYTTGSADFNNDNVDGSYQDYGLAIGHNAQRLWQLSEVSMARLSLGQSLAELYDTLGSVAIHRLDHTATLGWNKAADGGASYAAMTVADRHAFGDDRSDQQFFNLQLNRQQQITRRNSLSGSITLQRVLQHYEGEVNYPGVTTTTGRFDFNSVALFGVPRLRFNSNLNISLAAQEEGVDRREWGNRLDYLIGQLTTSVSHRFIQYDDRQYQLVFFSIFRQF